MLFRKKQINSVSDFITKLKKDASSIKTPIWYRGQENNKWPLVPSIYRGKKKYDEMNLIKRFKQNATLLLNPNPGKLIYWLFIMQHHGIPTRLLDWTESPLVALYFAVYERPNSDGALYAMLPVELNGKANIKLSFSNDIPSFEEDDILDNYDPGNFSSETKSELLPVAFIAPRNNPRMQSQLSVFTINHRDKQPLEKAGDGKHIWRYIIPKKFKPTIKKELQMLGIGKFQLFPELSSIANIIKE